MLPAVSLDNGGSGWMNICQRAAVERNAEIEGGVGIV
uniref:Uncharacterized protein n=1 Tax=Medicago truncatula TaxID=3880 RepID=Q2HT29_MEDTR|nr:hypothetical protein MtrDRAFT_AC150798g20v2 [Medicago truncatula]